jgi:hypothetical protein
VSVFGRDVHQGDSLTVQLNTYLPGSGSQPSTITQMCTLTPVGSRHMMCTVTGLHFTLDPTATMQADVIRNGSLLGLSSLK